MVVAVVLVGHRASRVHQRGYTIQSPTLANFPNQTVALGAKRRVVLPDTPIRMLSRAITAPQLELCNAQARTKDDGNRPRIHQLKGEDTPEPRLNRNCRSNE